MSSIGDVVRGIVNYDDFAGLVGMPGYYSGSDKTILTALRPEWTASRIVVEGSTVVRVIDRDRLRMIIVCQYSNKPGEPPLTPDEKAEVAAAVAGLKGERSEFFIWIADGEDPTSD